MKDEALLYIYRNRSLGQVYIGIGASAERIWGGHNPAATALLEHPETEVVVTAESSPDRASAERAESAAIFAAAAASVTVLTDRDDISTLTNIAKLGSSRHLSRAVYQREGVVHYDDLAATAIVILALSSIDDMADGPARPTLHGGRHDAVVRDRATRWWGLDAANQRRRKKTVDGVLPRDVTRLIAVRKGSVATILGAWDLTETQWLPGPQGWFFDSEPEISPETAELRGQRLDWDGIERKGSLIWSRDLRAVPTS